MSATQTTATPAPHTLTIQGAISYSGCSRSRLYDAIKAGQLEARQIGRRTLIVGDSLRAFLDGLPKAGRAQPGQKKAA